ncbi:MAG: BatA domain-containing protein [Phycisphaerae bacterium]|nr:BatA domain-containing protein [Phycisphaerae bacterium]
MFEGLQFGAPAMLLGLLAAAIPFVLHLLSSVRAQEVYYPTLRFLKLSMEKTARRRHLQHWLLLIIRALMLGLLAIVVSEPLFKGGKEWFNANNAACVVIIDNSYSMNTLEEKGSRLELARTEARELLFNDDERKRPKEAALLLTHDDKRSVNLTGNIKSIEEPLKTMTVGYGKGTPIAARVREAVAQLSNVGSTPEKTVYILTDLQRESIDDLLGEAEDNVLQLARDNGVHVLIVNVGQPNAVNVGVTDLEIAGRRIADQPIQFNVTLTNSTNENIRVNVDLHIEGMSASDRQTITLPPMGKETRQFRHTFTRPDMFSGSVSVAIISEAGNANSLVDQLDTDNRRYFALEIGDRVRAVIVRGHAGEDGSGLDGTTYLKPALDGLRNVNRPWSIEPDVIDIADFGPEALTNASMLLLNEVDHFTDEQAQCVIDFVDAGGTALFFLGPECDVANYNKMFYDDLGIAGMGPLLPGKIGGAQGDVGPGAMAEDVELMDLTSPFLAGLYPNAESYRVMMVNRYYTIEDVVAPASAIMTLRSGSPLVATRPFGKGRAVVFPTTASPRWSNFCAGGSPVFFSMLYRMALAAPQQMQSQQIFLAQTNVPISTGPLRADSSRPNTVTFAVTTPDKKILPLTAELDNATGYTVRLSKENALPGVYTWTLQDAPDDLATRRSEGAFAVNPDGDESFLLALGTEEMQNACDDRDFNTVFVGSSLKDVQERAAEASQGAPWWDKFLPLVILLLIVEALIANRRKLNEGTAIPTHLSPAMPKSA